MNRVRPRVAVVARDRFCPLALPVRRHCPTTGRTRKTRPHTEDWKAKIYTLRTLAPCTITGVKRDETARPGTNLTLRGRPVLVQAGSGAQIAPCLKEPSRCPTASSGHGEFGQEVNYMDENVCGMQVAAEKNVVWLILCVAAAAGNVSEGGSTWIVPS